MNDICIEKAPIRLGQFLKVAELTQDGLTAKLRIQHGDVLVNGIQELRRGRKLFEGDTVTIDGSVYRVYSKHS